MLVLECDEDLDHGSPCGPTQVFSGKETWPEESKSIGQHEIANDEQAGSAIAARESARGEAHELPCALSSPNYDDPDWPLVEAAKQGDRLAFSELSARHRATVYQKVFRLVRNHEDAEDVVQETLLKAFRHLTRFRGTAKFSTWLLRIGINSALELLRSKRRTRESSFERRQDDESWEVMEFPDPAPDAEQLYAKSQTGSLVSVALGRLPRTYQAIIRRYHQEEHSLAEVARMLGISVSAAKARLFRARVTLRSVLKEGNLTNI